MDTTVIYVSRQPWSSRVRVRLVTGGCYVAVSCFLFALFYAFTLAVIWGEVPFYTYLSGLFQQMDIGPKARIALLFAPLLPTFAAHVATDRQRLHAQAARHRDQLLSAKETLERQNEFLEREVGRREAVERELRKKESMYRGLFAQSNDGIIVHDLDGRILDVNGNALRQLGHERDEMLSLSVLDLYSPESVEIGRRALAATAETEAAEYKAKLRKTDGQVFQAYVRANLFRHDSLNYVQTVVRDLSEQMRAEAAATTAEGRLRHLLLATPAVIYSARPEGDFGVTYISENVEKVLHYPPGEITADPGFWDGRVHRDDIGSLQALRRGASKQERLAHEYRFRRKDGSYVWLYDEFSMLSDGNGRPREIIGYLIDISDRKRLEEKLQHDALHDGLTKLPNRVLLLDRLRVCLARAQRNKEYSFALLFMDLDRFKVINDNYGHAVGDELLVAVAERLMSCLRYGDSVARLSGDEFAVLLDDMNGVQDALVVADRIQRKLEASFSVGELELYTSASLGIATFDSQHTAPEDLLRDADIAMYEAKAAGGAGHALFDDHMRVRSTERLQLENDLRRATEQDEFQLLYQPIVAIGDRSIKGFEALLRWKHPESGLLRPADFIHIAEEVGIIRTVGRQALQRACRQMRSWQTRFPSEPPISISVNVSAKQFTQDLVEDVRQVLHETGLDTRSLVIELTESAIMQNVDMASSLMAQLEDLNIKFHIDDFGTGYSSLSHIHQFPISVLKVDKSFVSGLPSDKEKHEIVRAIIGLGHSLNLTVIAEGVETDEQLDTLTRLGCDYAQGFLFASPLEVYEVEELLSNSRPASPTA